MSIMRYRVPTLLLAIAFGLLPIRAGFSRGIDVDAQNQAPPAGSPLDAVLARLPADWQSFAKTLTLSDAQQGQFAGLSDVALRQAVARLLVRRPEADEFVKGQLQKDAAPAVRTVIAQAIGGDTRWMALPDTVKILEHVVTADADVGVSLAALEVLRRARMRQLTGLLGRRVAAAKAGGDSAVVARLADEQDRWISLERATILPAFLRVPPPAFIVAPPNRRVRVLAFGDFGNGSDAQKNLARTIAAYHRRRHFDAGITLGDNFYSVGMESPADPRWTTWWESLYGPLGITFYAALGNHDWGHPDSPAAEILYSRQSRSWRMPAAYYTFTAGAVQFFALDTQTLALSDRQLQWLDDELSNSQAAWKVVYGHHPIYSGGRYEDRPDLVARLMPVLRNRADVYICGHDHNLQALAPEDGVRFFVAGGGGAGLYELRPYERSLFAASTNGFAVIEADSARLTVTLVDAAGKPVYEDTIRRDVAARQPVRRR